MAKITRVTQQIFGSTASGSQIAQFGSLAAGTPAFTTNPAAIQSLSNYLQGWFAAVVGANSPAIEDMNAICYLYAYQLAYLMQTGVPEWDSATTYYTGSVVSAGTQLYMSLVDTNINQAVNLPAKWRALSSGSAITTTSATATALYSDEYIRANPTSASFVQTLPAVAATPLGKRITIKNVATNGNTVTVKGNGSELIDQANTVVLESATFCESVTVLNNGTSWDII